MNLRSTLARFLIGLIVLLAGTTIAAGQCQLIGDVNQDQSISVIDVSFFAGCLIGQPVGGSDCSCADINQDGAANGEDTAGFVSLLLDPGPQAGACCSWIHPHCQVVTEAQCDGLAGMFHGEGTDCSADVNSNGHPDLCETDCNQNLIPDEYEIGLQWVDDCNANGIPDMCEPDCNANGIPDPCEILQDPQLDCNHNRRPDDCDISEGLSSDCNANGIPDACDIADCDGSPGCADCNRNGRPDECDIQQGLSPDCDMNGQPDECARCLIPGDMNGDQLVTAADDPLFMVCQTFPCAPVPCECADIDGDGIVGPVDQILYDQIRNDVTPAQTMAIVDFSPKTLTTGGIMEVDGFGFGSDIRDLSVAVTSLDGTKRIPLAPFELIPIENGLQRIRARVGAVLPEDEPGLVEVRLGDGAFGPFQFSHPGAVVPQGGRRWQISTSSVAVDDHRFFDDFAVSTLSPCQLVSLRAGVLNNGRIELVVPHGFDSGAQLRVQFSALRLSGEDVFGVEGSIPKLEFSADKSAVETAEAIGASITQLFASLVPPVVINTSVTPMGNEALLIAEAPFDPFDIGRLIIEEPRVEIEVNLTPEDDDDYLTWAPTYCRARLRGYLVTGIPTTRTVVLTNDSPNPSGAGNVRFSISPYPPPETTPTDTSLTLDLPRNGDWVYFTIAGEYGSPSTSDNDTAIEAHDGSSAGELIGYECMMVRVRKNAEDLTTAERDRYVNAILALHAAGGYEVFQEIHSLVTNQGHTTPAFLPWHRAFVLEYERALQAVDPSVAAHYWDFTAAAPSVFSDEFMGANDASGEVSGPFEGWTIDGLTTIRRGSGDHQGVSTSVNSDTTTLAPSTFDDFRDMEGNPHGTAHLWVGGWMGAAVSATRDPVFFMLHSNVERLYCKWQSLGHHGTGTTYYDPQGAFVCGTSTDSLGAHLEDTMWPWNGETGDGACSGSLDTRPSTAPGGTFDPPPAPGFDLGPPAMPTIEDVIDYLGRFDPADGLGFCYDDTPYN